jgi:DNA-binding MarR family transcriptional regulator
VDEVSPQAGGEVFEHAPDASYLHLWREVILTYRQFMRRVAAHTDYSGAQFEVLRQLAVADGRSTVSALARELAVDPAAVTRLVAGLTSLGLVGRESDASDRRRRPVVLTDEGRRSMGGLHAFLHERETTLTEGIDAQAIETSMRVLQAMRAAVDSLPRRRP